MQAKDFFHHLDTALQTAADPARAGKMSAYMRDQFSFYGVMAPERKLIVREIVKAVGRPGAEEFTALSELCFATGRARELAYAFGDLYIPQKKKLPADLLPRIEQLTLTTSWWDTVDWLVPHLAGAILLRDHDLMEKVSRRWVESDNIWLQRSALIFQLHYKQATRADLLFAYVKRRADSKEFFVQKGAGWALRQYSRIDPEAVVEFIENNELPALTVREGLKLLNK